jgi:hypothetical protein
MAAQWAQFLKEIETRKENGKKHDIEEVEYEKLRGEKKRRKKKKKEMPIS